MNIREAFGKSDIFHAILKDKDSNKSIVANCLNECYVIDNSTAERVKEWDWVGSRYRNDWLPLNLADKV